jgi:hypothetical protein
MSELTTQEAHKRLQEAEQLRALADKEHDELRHRAELEAAFVRVNHPLGDLEGASEIYAEASATKAELAKEVAELRMGYAAIRLRELDRMIAPLQATLEALDAEIAAFPNDKSWTWNDFYANQHRNIHALSAEQNETFKKFCALKGKQLDLQNKLFQNAQQREHTIKTEFPVGVHAVLKSPAFKAANIASAPKPATKAVASEPAVAKPADVIAVPTPAKTAA